MSSWNSLLSTYQPKNKSRLGKLEMLRFIVFHFTHLTFRLAIYTIYVSYTYAYIGFSIVKLVTLTQLFYMACTQVCHTASEEDLSFDDTLALWSYRIYKKHWFYIVTIIVTTGTSTNVTRMVHELLVSKKYIRIPTQPGSRRQSIGNYQQRLTRFLNRDTTYINADGENPPRFTRPLTPSITDQTTFQDTEIEIERNHES